MNETQLLLWPVVISALKKKKKRQTKKTNQTQQTNKQTKKKVEFKKEPECNYGEVWEV